uniref:Secreted protein n=1 Tax=Populus trichocarpa TaxID=3694 RepID=A0A2K2AGD6_POPTR
MTNERRNDLVLVWRSFICWCVWLRLVAGKDLTDSCKSEGLCRLKEGENRGLWLYCHQWSDEWKEELTTVVIVRIYSCWWFSGRYG